jgi:hypothetical protein
MYKLYKQDDLLTKDMTPVEIALIYNLFSHDCYNRHIDIVSVSSFYYQLFNEHISVGCEKHIRQEFTLAIKHLIDLGLITVVNENNKNKEIDFSLLVSDKYILLADDAYKIFNIRGENKTSLLKIFKLYVYMIDSLYRSPTLSGKTYKDYYLGFLPAKQICNEMGITHNTYTKYIKYLEDLKLLYVKRDNTYRRSLDTGSNTSNSYRVPYVYCHYKDKAKADEYVTKRNELDSYHTSTTTTTESKLHKRYAALYNQICNGNTDYELNELKEIYEYLKSENEKNALEKKKHSNTLYAESLKIRDLSILEDLIKIKQQEQDYDMPF